MTTSSHYPVRIAAPASAGAQSRARKQFNNLVKKLEAERAKLALWREELPKIQALADREYRPLAEQFDAHRKQLLLIYDRAYDHRSTGKKDKEKLQALICPAAWELMEADDDELIKAIFNKHSGGDYDKELNEEKERMLKVVGSMTGLDLDAEAFIHSPDAFFASLEEKFAEREHNARQGEPAESPKPSKREEKHLAEQAKLKQSVRDIFRKLASALHPDRETDPAERERKTGLMQRANLAYAANDLLGLLELQLEVDQIDQTGLDNLGDEHIKQYNRVLSGQLDDISGELFDMEMSLARDIGWESNRRPVPKTVLKMLHTDIATMRVRIAQAEAEIAEFADIGALKRWLKTLRIVRNSPFDDGPWF
ncbi:hypothetical protein INH39_01790 [Massilia violaceinigra]|uniref:Molecular chaperone DnaJ n=1 Tax=Massilia violaceinigra TaxID=2045208 RepID=A0ABY4A793_9BURK|nr:hypothetical protein [Massilia violaceinigra]UOD30507.1 hypothetical protein INH39_01790 [Massilia violaceinigra]